MLVAAALALAASVSQVVAGPIDHIGRAYNHRQVARGYAQDAPLLEDYTPYHVRYLALDCQDKHNTTFFEECCHPLLRWQKLSKRPSYCTPSASAVSSASAAEPSATPIDEDPIPDECDPEEDPEDECEPDEPTPTTAVVTSRSSSHKAEPTTEAPSSTYHAPSTTHTPTSTHKTSSAEPSETSKPDSGDLITGGQATFYKQGGVAGACGDKHDDYDLIVAMDYRRYGDINSVSKFCGKMVEIKNLKTGKSVKAKIADVCPTCRNGNSLDLSHGTWDALGSPRSDGVFEIQYEML